MPRQRGLFILDETSFGLIYGPSEIADIQRHVELVGPPQTKTSIVQNRHLLKNVDVIFSGWGAPKLDQAFLADAPNLKALFYGAGSVGYCLSDAVWERRIKVTSAIEANSQPVAEYTLAMIILCLKHTFQLSRETHTTRQFVERNGAPGSYGATVGLVSVGRITRILLKLLKPFDLKIIAHDPFVSATEAARLGIELVSLEEVFERADVVSIHTPVTPQTRHMITGAHVASMKPGAAFINTARGELVRERELLEVAAKRPDLQFILDVTEQEPPAVDSPLYALPNIFLTPHIAGSAGPECRRMGRWMVEELERFIAGRPLKWEVMPDKPIAPPVAVEVAVSTPPARFRSTQTERDLITIYAK